MQDAHDEPLELGDDAQSVDSHSSSLRFVATSLADWQTSSCELLTLEAVMELNGRLRDEVEAMHLLLGRPNPWNSIAQENVRLQDEISSLRKRIRGTGKASSEMADSTSMSLSPEQRLKHNFRGTALLEQVQF